LFPNPVEDARFRTRSQTLLGHAQGAFRGAWLAGVPANHGTRFSPLWLLLGGDEIAIAGEPGWVSARGPSGEDDSHLRALTRHRLAQREILKSASFVHAHLVAGFVLRTASRCRWTSAPTHTRSMSPKQVEPASLLPRLKYRDEAAHSSRNPEKSVPSSYPTNANQSRIA
jgi:hypothetical protein